MLITSVIAYFDYDVETVISVEPDGELKFPVITICNMQQCDLNDYNVYYYIEKYINSTKEDGSYNSNNLTIRRAYESIKNTFLTEHNKTTLEKIFNSKDSLEKYLINCEFGDEKCSYNDFQMFNLDELMKCFKFNSGKYFNGSDYERKNLKVSSINKKNGLHIELSIGIPDTCKSPISPTEGILVFVHNYTDKISREDYGFHLAPDTENRISIQRTLVKKLPAPFGDSNCVQNAENEKNDLSIYEKNSMIYKTYELNSMKYYSQKTCMQLCYQEELIKNFNCSDEYLPYIKSRGVKSCVKLLDSSLEKTNKNSSSYKQILEFRKSFDNDYCSTQCPIECEHMKYAVTLSSSQYPSMTYAELIMSYSNVSDLKTYKKIDDQPKNVIAINAFYPADSFTLIEDKPSLELWAFISNFGGTFGLFLGGSVLSFAEIVELIIECLIVYQSKKAKVNSN